jgi:hypothetical protein
MTEAFKAAGLHSAMYAIPVLAVLASLVLFAASRTVDGDIRKQQLLVSAPVVGDHTSASLKRAR